MAHSEVFQLLKRCRFYLRFGPWDPAAESSLRLGDAVGVAPRLILSEPGGRMMLSFAMREGPSGGSITAEFDKQRALHVVYSDPAQRPVAVQPFTFEDLEWLPLDLDVTSEDYASRRVLLTGVRYGEFTYLEPTPDPPGE